MNNKYTAMEIANYIVDYANKVLEAKSLTPIKLQKILYYVYVNCLVKQNTKLFNQPIEKWKFGPVVSSVYHNFKIYGVGHIDSTISDYEFSDNPNEIFSFKEIPFDSTNLHFSDNIAQEINSTIRELIDVDPFELVEQTHREAPWKLREQEILNGVRGLVYSDQEILNYLGK
ncbi:Panacea domain-containing protein [Acinetobacter sp. YH01026]|uniref:Panacea domain-containing protein n=1 Tax=Acinetobacter sp. YH01026 TaxID=2601039 RepID=UPI0015D105CB|nr:type II toxin-antitoxin system antitoxin SocA domain-containing protein [Acinetobacter sp. YH01026]